MAEPARPQGLAATSLRFPVAVPGDGFDAAPLVELPTSPALICDGGVVVQANTAAARLAGYRTPDAMLGVRVERLLVGPDSDARLLGPDGARVAVRSARWWLPGTDLLGISLVDVSDLVSDDAEASGRRLAHVERAVRTGSWEIDVASDEQWWSPGLYQICGLEPGSVRPSFETFRQAVHPDDRATLRSDFTGLGPNGWFDGECRVVRPDGEVRALQVRIEAQADEKGRVGRVAGTVRDVTDQRSLERELEAERVRLLDAERLARMGSFSWEPPTDRLTYSSAMAGLFAVSCLSDRKHRVTFMHPDDRQMVTAQLRDLIADPAIHTVEIDFRGDPDKGETHYTTRVRAERGKSGDVIRVLGTVQDVTESRLMERELRRERRRLSDAQRVARMGVWEWVPASDHLIWSDELRVLMGVDKAVAPTIANFMSFLHPDDRDWVEQLWWDTVDEHGSAECEFRLIRPDGEVRMVRTYGAVTVDPSGELRIVGTAQDVTEQRATEARVERSTRRFADLVALAPVGIGLVDDGGRIVDCNDALAGLLGYEREQLRGMRGVDLLHPDDVEQFRSASRRLEAPFTLPQIKAVRANGEPVSCEVQVGQTVQDDGQRFWLVACTDITERLGIAENLKYQATHDELTGLPNRAAIKELLASLLADPDSDPAVLFCDIDNFKRINDSLGHDAGDEALVALAKRLRDGLPDGCTAARLSGDVYVVICSDVSQHGGATQLISTVSELLRVAVPVRGQLVRVSAAIGVAVPDEDTLTPDDLLRFADAAMFQAKQQGAGQVALANAALIASADRQVALEGQLREALTGEGLELHFQPVVNADGAILTAEALIRWHHPERGMLPPDVFLPVAEQGGLMRELDRWVLRTALREAMAWTAPGGRPVAVAVNLAGLVPGYPDFVDTVATAIAESGIEWDRVVLELVETALVDLPSRTRMAMGKLVERGVRFAVDDFGTGYSSLARLKELPAQIVKVDRRFVSGVGADPSDFAVARAVVDMARAMGRSCVAEGVETATQFQVLRGLGVDAYQGWLFSRPVPSEQFREVLAKGPLRAPRAG